MADEKKIIIDEDWKSQVAAEKAAAEHSHRGTAEESPPATQSGQDTAPADFEMPPASWELFLTQLATEAMIGLGLIPHPATGQIAPNRSQAKYLIDTIEMLRDRAKGNLSPGESQLTDSLLHQLRMAYISLETSAGAETPQSDCASIQSREDLQRIKMPCPVGPLHQHPQPMKFDERDLHFPNRVIAAG